MGSLILNLTPTCLVDNDYSLGGLIVVANDRNGWDYVMEHQVVTLESNVSFL